MWKCPSPTAGGLCRCFQGRVRVVWVHRSEGPASVCVKGDACLPSAGWQDASTCQVGPSLGFLFTLVCCSVHQLWIVLFNLKLTLKYRLKMVCLSENSLPASYSRRSSVYAQQYIQPVCDQGPLSADTAWHAQDTGMTRCFIKPGLPTCRSNCWCGRGAGSSLKGPGCHEGCPWWDYWVTHFFGAQRVIIAAI